LPFFLYRLHFFEVFRDKGGFDIVIANPPYVRQEKIKHVKAALKAAYPQVYNGVADLYVYFYARGLDLLRPGGVLAYISSNKFMRAGYGEKLRKFLVKETTLETIVDFGDLPVFEATTYPCLMIIRKAKSSPSHMPRVLVIDNLEVIERLEEEIPRQSWLLPQAYLRPEGWTLERPEVLRLKEKLQSLGRPLRDVINGQFYRGIVTGLNKAFIIDDTTRQKLIEEDFRSAEVIRPWLRGRDIKRWRVEWAKLYVLYIPWDFSLEDYRAIKAHLERFKDQLLRRPEVQEGRFPWYALSRYGAEYAYAFNQSKLIYPHFSTQVNFALDESGAFSNDKTYIIPTAALFLLGVLNSRVSEFIMKQLSPTVQHGYMEFRTIYVGQLPIPDASPPERQTIEYLVQQLLTLRGEGPKAAELEQELNERVYWLFGLTQEEVQLIEQSVRKSKCDNT